MLKRTPRLAFIITILTVVIGLSGCILSPKDDTVPPDKPKYVYLDLTHKGDAIENLVTAYKEHNLTQVEKLLHPLYIWRNQDYDILHNELPEFYSRSEEVTSTTNIFLAAEKQSAPDKYIDKLELTIEDGSWQQVYEFQGEACEDCWQTTREYFITVVMSGGDLTLYGNDLVDFTIVPVTEGGKKLYKIGRADDRQKSG
jgi:hypothetical protein